jgi:glutamate/aspartate transport system substrate-binding protein
MRTKTTIALALTLLAGVAQADSFDRVVQTGTIKLGYREKSVPVSFKDAQGNPAGQTVDECKAFVGSLEQRLGKPISIEWVIVTPNDRIEAVKSGKIDLECGSTTNTEKRREDVGFSIPTYISSMRVAKMPSTIFKMRDLQSYKIDALVMDGTSAVDFISVNNDGFKTTKPDYNKVIVKDMNDALDKLKASKKPAIVIYDDILLMSAIQARTDKAAFQITDDRLSVDPYGIMFAKGSKIGNYVNEFLATEMTSGQFKKTYDKWFMSDIKDPYGNTINLNNPMSNLLSDVIRFPSNIVGN